MLKKILRPFYNRIRYTETYKNLDVAWLCHARPLIWQYHARRMKTSDERETFQDVNTFLMFLGHPRSGHSIIAACMDAHPNIVLSEDMDVLKYIRAGFDRDQIFRLILKRSQALKGRQKEGRRGSTYSYMVPGQWQGKYERIRVIGDKRGGSSTTRLASEPELLHRLKQTVNTDIKCMVVLRNPYDNISTMFLRNDKRKSLRLITDNYFKSCGTILSIRQRMSRDNILFMRHEAFIDDSAACLRDICRFLGLRISGDYLNACTGIVYPSPIKSRHEITWEPDMIEIVRKQIILFDFLADYAYEI